MEKVKKFFSSAIITQESTLPQSEAKTNFRNFSGDRPCPRCGSTTPRTGAGRKPGEASLICSNCKRFVRWLSASEFALGGER